MFNFGHRAMLTLLMLTKLASASSLPEITSQTFARKDFKLDGGAVLSELKIAFETYGHLAHDGRNAILIVHSFTANQHAAGLYAENGGPPGIDPGEIGWWDKMIGPGASIDTNKYFVVSANALGSCYGSTGPASLNPTTGKPYGPDFPSYSVADVVRAQKELLDSLGVKHIVAVIGASYGGFEAFEWAADNPNYVSGIAAFITAPYSLTPPQAEAKLVDYLAKDPNWNGGHYYESGGVAVTMAKLRVATLEAYGADALFKDRIASPALRAAALADAARKWAASFDANSLIAILSSHRTFDLRPRLAEIKAKVFYALSRTDKLFPTTIAPAVMAALKSDGVDARYFEIDSDYGHTAFESDTDKFAAPLRGFVDGLAR